MSAPINPWQILRPVRGRIHLAMLLSAFGALAGLATLALLALALQALLEQPDAWPWPALAAALLCSVAAYTLRLNASNRTHLAAFRLETLLRTQLAEHLARIPLGRVQQLGSGGIVKVMQDDVKALHVFVADSTPLYARAYVLPPVTLALLLWLDWRLAVAALLLLIAGYAVLALAMRNRAQMVARYNAARERVSAAVVEFVQAMPVVRSFDTGQSTFGRYQRALDEYLQVLQQWYRHAGFAARFSLAALNPMPTLTLLLALGAWLYWQGTLQLPSWVAVLLLGSGMAEAMLPMMMIAHLVDKARLSIARIDEVLAIAPLPVPDHDAARIPHDASVRFDNVGFRYGQGDQQALAEVSFHAPAGSITALVGPSGAGKSTLARLIPRFWDVDVGSVQVGGVDVRQIDSDALMAQVAYVFQDNFLFSGSIADNIRMGRADASDAELIAAAQAAQAHDFIDALPQGYASRVGERGVRLSGGQRQRICIARALLQDAPILVLDEATAFADPENEAALVQALAALMRGRTVLMIAHRLSTVRDADQILVFEHGRLIERGRHAALIHADGSYARLWHDYEQASAWNLQAEPST